MKETGTLLIAHWKGGVAHGPYTKIGKNGVREVGEYVEGRRIEIK